jgi:hypothetical protein
MKKMNKNRRGSMFIGVLVIMILVLAIALAVIRRTTVGTIITTDSHKGYSAYQESDSGVEKILNAIKSLDGDTSSRIPENTPATDPNFCSSGAICYDKDNGIINSSRKVSDIDKVEKSGESGSAERAINASVPERIDNPLSVLSVRLGSLNKCDIALNWTLSSSSDDRIDSLEVRYSGNNRLLSSGEWTRPNQFKFSYDPLVTEATISNENFSYDTKYAFTMKAKNKNNFSLDSLYYTPTQITIPPKNCSGGRKLGCVAGSAPEKSHESAAAYTCCGGTKCYECDTERAGGVCL